MHIPHGRSNAIILPHIIKFNANLNGGLYNKDYSLAAKKYQRLAKLLKLHAPNVHIGVNNLIRKIEELQKNLMIPTTLTKQGVDIGLLEESMEEILKAALKDVCTEANPRAVTREDLSNIIDKLK